MKESLRFSISLLLLIGLLGTIVSGCTGAGQHKVAMAGIEDMPEHVQTAPVRVREAYQFAVANPDVLEQIPCYCGCGAMGHQSNYSCYVAEEATGGLVTYDEHALDCGICIDITQDVMRLQTQDNSVADIFVVIENTYARFGPPTPLN